MKINVQTLFVVLSFGVFQVSDAKDVNIKNMSNQSVGVKWAHFGSSWAGAGRPLVIEELLLQPGQQQRVDVKPYNYDDVTYFPDKDYFASGNSLSTSDQEKLKEKGLETHNLVVSSADGKKKAYFLSNDETGAGAFIKVLPESGKDDPSTGLFLKELANSKYSLKILTPEGSDTYEAIVDYKK